jgi:fucose 4-O-acetylase-like acetyltransferase
MAFRQFSNAAKVAAATPDSRNRYVDFLRAVAISAVVVGHWLMAAVWIDGSGFHAEEILGIVEATQWLTWALQVMPIFFFVGGFSNAAGWGRRSGTYTDWLRNRLQRLVLPTLPLVAIWAGIGLIAPGFGIDAELTRLASQVALVPLWFLAVYVVMVAATPLTVTLWDRRGGRAVVALTAAALATDLARFLTIVHVGIANYAFVWGSIYLLGHAWQRGFFADARSRRLLAAAAGSALIGMTVAGPYHIAMVGIPDVEFGNSGPPSAALLALGFTQIGIVLSAENAMRRILARHRVWTITVLVNSSIMTLYAWHMTVMAAALALMKWQAPALLGFVPGGAMWWLSRPLWLGMLAVATLPFMAVFRRFEAIGRNRDGARTSVPGPLVATVGVGVSFVSVASHGISTTHPFWAMAAIVPLGAVFIWLRRTGRRQDCRELQGS